MKKLIILIYTLTFLSMSLLNAQDAKEIVNNSTKAIMSDAMEMTSTLKIYDNKGNVRTRQVKNTTKKFGDATKTMIKFLSPADVQGTGMLIYDYEEKDDDMWVYLPSLKKTRRIVSSEKSSSFMGSEFSNSDMSKPKMSDYEYKLLGTETINGKEYYKIESTCKSPEIETSENFKRKIAYIEKVTYLPYKTETYDKDNKLIKTITMTDYRKQTNGKYMAYKMVAENNKNGRKSEIIITSFVTTSSLEENYFSTSNLEK
ncbi:MAG TPA: outer membrane lipoprotein-sorting protein [Bacteroidales bacterium]|nr:outer membrane lipoprotein-sorting protein [Bacteroidales bacterium]